MKQYKLIMCDLDNTLLPIYTQERFAEMWLRDMSKKFAQRGLELKPALDGVSRGIRAMIFNESGKKNIDVFYEVVKEVSGYTEAQIAPILYDYYTTTFENVYDLTLPNPYAVRIAELMRMKAQYAVIATMPVFTMEAVEARMAWVGLNPEMFDYITTAVTSSYSKPNPLYFQEILDRFRVKPDEALMIGNDVREDMQPCKALGIDTFLVTNHIITHDLPFDEFRRGGYADLVAFLESLSE
ncbi:HAD family hydrolase [uncultured Ruminococcus sp.]|uniref:HAD family hydrolase n=1 Tax=uncultured Ruminococcus sp. TaxID=165186 RepID=UPI00292E3EBD|nr:HAD family hydrolase [uncultured Ruminococcus sp.]